MQEQIAHDLRGEHNTGERGNIDPKRNSTGSNLHPRIKPHPCRVGWKLIINQGIEPIEYKRYVLYPLQPIRNRIRLNEKPATTFQKRKGRAWEKHVRTALQKMHHIANAGRSEHTLQ